jgi:hypothetical protein
VQAILQACSAGNPSGRQCRQLFRHAGQAILPGIQCRQSFRQAVQTILQACSAGKPSACNTGNPSACSAEKSFSMQCRQSFRNAVQAILRHAVHANPSGMQCRQSFRHAVQAILLTCWRQLVQARGIKKRVVSFYLGDVALFVFLCLYYLLDSLTIFLYAKFSNLHNQYCFVLDTDKLTYLSFNLNTSQYINRGIFGSHTLCWAPGF